MITLIKYEEKYRPALEDYPLSDEHLSFTGHPLELIERSETNPTYSPIIILENGRVAGFFVLDTGEDKYHYTNEHESILLRGYSIHPTFQGLGIAKTSIRLLPSYTIENFPQVKEIVLGVNEANLAAQAVYVKEGFIDEGKRHTGRSGVQIAMCLKL